ncbi:MAG: ABC transporter substrate-binding protein [Burkholderiales bacterium]|jgi:putative ABC transport system substrate-binding protein
MNRLWKQTFWLMLMIGLTAIAAAQETAGVPVIGVLRASSPARHDPGMEAVRAKLQELGYVEGRNIRFEQRFANNHPERLPQLASELAAMNVKILIAVNEASLRAAKQATSTIPIVVIAHDHDPVASGLIDSMNRPGGNVTGIISRQLELVGKRLELLKETIPGLSRVAVLYDPAREADEDIEAAAKQLGLQLRMVELKSPPQFENSMKLAAKQAQAAVLLFSPMLFDARTRLAKLAADARLPTMTQTREFVVAGALMSYAPDRTEISTRMVYFIDRLLRGATPHDLPVEEATRFKLSLNLRTAKTLGLTIPKSILLRADEVIR